MTEVSSERRRGEENDEREEGEEGEEGEERRREERRERREERGEGTRRVFIIFEGGTGPLHRMLQKRLQRVRPGEYFGMSPGGRGGRREVGRGRGIGRGTGRGTATGRGRGRGARRMKLTATT